jgi:predicted kinase
MKPPIPNTPHVIIMVGIPGSGKTTFAEHFAKTFQAPYINPGTISRLTNIDAEATEKVTKLLFDELLKTKQTLVYEGSTYLRPQRIALENMIAKAGYKALFVWVQTDPVESKRRATRKQKDTISLSASAFDAAFRQFQNPSQAEKPVVISGKHTYVTQLKAVLKRLAPTRPDVPPTPEQPRTVSGRNIIVR